MTDGLTGCSVSGGTGVVVAAGKSVNLSYSCTFTSAVSGPNSATATWDLAAYFTPDGSASGSAPFSFSTPTPVNQTTTPTDSFNGGSAVNLCTLQACTPCTLTAKDTTPYTTQTYTYSRTVAAGNGTCVTYNNTAAITGATAGASVQACGAADLTVSKTASVSIPTYTWSINKAVSPTAPWNRAAQSLSITRSRRASPRLVRGR